MVRRLKIPHSAGVCKEELVDLRDIVVDNRLPMEERIKSYVEQIGNPYCFKVGGVVVSVSYSNDRTTFNDRFTSLLSVM